MFDKISTGALNDLEKVTRQARAIVSIYGLNEKIGNITYYDSSGQNEYGFTKPYSELTAQTIDEEISKIIEKQYQRAIKLLEKHKDKLVELAEILTEKEVIFEVDLVKIFGERPFSKEIAESKEIAKRKKTSKKSDSTDSEEEITEDKKTSKKSDSTDSEEDITEDKKTSKKSDNTDPKEEIAEENSK